MTFKEEIVAVQARLAQAEAERDTWRTSGMQEKYLGAHSAVEALEVQLEALRQQGLRNTAGAEAAAPAPAGSSQSAGDRHRLMAGFSISYNGRRYRYDRYCYDLLKDAVDYARLQCALPPPERPDAADAMAASEVTEAPDESARELMAAHGITFQEGVYRLGEYRYDRLVDAVNYARLRRLHARAAPPAS